MLPLLIEMASDGINFITKIAIMVISGILIGVSGYKLYLHLADDRKYETEKIIDICFVAGAMLLAILAFWGAFTENACLCYISLGFVIVILVFTVWELIRCFLEGGKVLNL